MNKKKNPNAIYIAKTRNTPDSAILSTKVIK